MPASPIQYDARHDVRHDDHRGRKRDEADGDGAHQHDRPEAESGRFTVCRNVSCLLRNRHGVVPAASEDGTARVSPRSHAIPLRTRPPTRGDLTRT